MPARTVRGGGARVTRVVPRLLAERGLADDTCDELVVTEDMGDRKTTMVARSDAFLALPCGLGALDELLVHVAPVRSARGERTVAGG